MNNHVNQEVLCRELSVDMVMNRGIFKNNLIALLFNHYLKQGQAFTPLETRGVNFVAYEFHR